MDNKEKQCITIKHKTDVRMVIISDLLTSILTIYDIKDNYVFESINMLNKYICDKYLLNFDNHPELNGADYDIEKENYEVEYIISKY